MIVKRLFLISHVLMFVLALMAQTTPTVSVSGVSIKYCRPTTSNISLRILSNENWNGYTFSEDGVYVRNLINQAGCDSIVTLDVTVLKGTLPGIFSVSKTEKIYFSKGNLQFNANPPYGIKEHKVNTGITARGVFRFAENQYDYIERNNMMAASSFGGWIDLMSYGTSCHDDVYPYMISNNISHFPVSDVDSTNYDWGVFNAISNGGDQPNIWFTLTADQWTYLINMRTNAALLRSVGTVNNKSGVILLPDDWELPSGCHFIAQAKDSVTNIYTIEDWKRMETAGAVFLPAIGRREIDANGIISMQYPYIGYYWASTSSSSGSAYYLYVNSQSGSITVSSGTTTYARAVRLVRYAFN